MIIGIRVVRTAAAKGSLLAPDRMISRAMRSSGLILSSVYGVEQAPLIGDYNSVNQAQNAAFEFTGFHKGTAGEKASAFSELIKSWKALAFFKARPIR